MLVMFAGGYFFADLVRLRVLRVAEMKPEVHTADQPGDVVRLETFGLMLDGCPIITRLPCCANLPNNVVHTHTIVGKRCGGSSCKSLDALKQPSADARLSATADRMGELEMDRRECKSLDQPVDLSSSSSYQLPQFNYPARWLPTATFLLFAQLIQQGLTCSSVLVE